MIEAELPDGTILEFPDNTPPDVVQRAVKSRLNVAAPVEQKASLPAQIGMGALRGAGSIGATILSPIDAAARAMGIQNSFIGRTDRREAMDEALRGMGADTQGLPFQAGKLGAEVAGTAGTGGVLSGAAKAAGAPAALVEALRSAGMVGGNLGTRMGAGAATGAAAAGLINPEDAGTGAMIGGALPLVSKVASTGIDLGRKLLGSTTGVGDEALRQAFLAGKTGGAQGEAFKGALRGESSIDDVLGSAKQNLQALGQQRQQAYRAGMANIKADKTVLDFNDVDNALQTAIDSVKFKGQVKSPSAASALNEVSGEISRWKSLNPAEYHTPEGLDALKQRISDIQQSIDLKDENARRVVGNVYNAIKESISKQAPEYSKVMKDYSSASETIKEIERSLSLGKTASADTAMRKLQSLLRNNVNTSYGYRTALAEQLQKAGGQEMMAPLAGQALSEWTPRGIQRATAGTGGAGLLFTGNPLAAAGVAATSSPRLMGEAFYGAGKAAGAVNPRLIEALRQGAYRAAPVIPSQE